MFIARSPVYAVDYVRIQLLKWIVSIWSLRYDLCPVGVQLLYYLVITCFVLVGGESTFTHAHFFFTLHGYLFADDTQVHCVWNSFVTDI